MYVASRVPQAGDAMIIAFWVFLCKDWIVLPSSGTSDGTVADTVEFTRETAIAMDEVDPLAGFEERFETPGKPTLYMDGNSLGRIPRDTPQLLADTLRTWQNDFIIAWREWIHLPEQLGDLIASSVVEAKPGEIIVGDSTTVNLYKAAAAAIGAQTGRRTIVTTDDNFPTDLYVLQSLAAQHSLTLKIIPADPIEGLDTAQLAETIDEDTALVCLSHVAYRSGALLDMDTVTRLVHSSGSLILWDISHSAGSVPVPLESSGADLAVGCTYKYLNGGPGAPAFVYVRDSEQARLRQPIWGWFGHQNQFAMSTEFQPAKGIESFLAGAPSVLSTVAIGPALAHIAEAGIDRLRVKGKLMTELIVTLSEEWLVPRGFSLASPRDAERRGSHVTLRHPKAKDFVRGLIAHDVIPDFRPSDMIRFGPAPLYTRFVDVWDALDCLRQLHDEGIADGA